MSTRKGKVSTLDTGYNFKTVSSPNDIQITNSVSYIQAELEREYQIKFQQLQHLYEMRVEALSEAIREAFDLVQNDELIGTMQQDSTSEEFVNQRVKELIEECINGNREALIEKLSQEISDLHVEYGKLENENAKLINQQENLVDEANRKITDAEEKREFFKDEAEKLEKTLQALERKYEESLKKKEEQMSQRTERDMTEIHMMRDKLRDLETQLRENDKQQAILERELEFQKTRNREQELDISTLNMELTGVTTREEGARKKIMEQEENFRNLKAQVESLAKENEQLKENLDASENDKRGVEGHFKNKIEEIQNAVQKEQERQKEANENLQKKYREKLEKYKKKIIELKNRMAEKEKEVRDLSRKAGEDRIVQEKNVEITQLKLHEQRDSYENKIMQIEEENHQKLNELQLRYDEQLRDLQTQFQKVLDQKIDQIQEDAQEQISQIRDQERELQEILEEKILQVERDYIKVTQHEEILLEKDKLIERLKQELTNKDIDYRQDTNAKIRNVEGRLREELEEKEKALKNLARDFEGKLSSIEGEKRKIREELEDRIDEIKLLTRSMGELEAQKKKLYETVEEWTIKSKKLKEAYEEEHRKRAELERNVKEHRENYVEMKDLLDETKEETANREHQISYLQQELANMENSLEGHIKQYRGLEREYEEMKREFMRREQNKEKLVAELKIEIEDLKDENELLREKIAEAEKKGEEKYGHGVRDHEETKAKLKHTEGRVKVMTAELKEYEGQVKRLNDQMEEIERENSKLRSKLTDLESAFTETEQDKMDLIQRINRSKVSNEEFRRGLEVALTAKLRSLRSELREVEVDCLTITNTVKRETESKIEGLLVKFKKLLERKNEQSKNEKEMLREKLDREFSFEIQGVKEEYEQAIQDFNLKLTEKEKMIESLGEKNDNLKGKIEALEVEIRNEKGKRMELEDEIEQKEKEINDRKKDKENLEKKLDEIKARLMNEIDEMSRQLRKNEERFIVEKRELEEKHESEKDQLNIQIDITKEKLRQTMLSYEERVNVLTNNQTEGLIKIKKEYENELDKLHEELAMYQESEEMQKKEIVRLRDEIDRLNQVINEIEKQKNDLGAMYEARIEELESALQDANNFTKREGQKLEEFKIDKLTEIKRYRKLIQELEDDLQKRGEQIAELLEERNKFLEIIEELKRQIEDKENEVEKQKLNIVGKSVQQTRDIEQVHKLLTKSYKTVNESLERSKEKDSEIDINKSVEELKKLEKYLERRSPSRSYTSNNYRESDTLPTRNLTESDHKSLRDKRSWPNQSKN